MSAKPKERSRNELSRRYRSEVKVLEEDELEDTPSLDGLKLPKPISDDEDEDDDEEDEDDDEPASSAGLRVHATTLGRIIAAVNAASDEIFRDSTADRLFSAVVDLTIRTAVRFGLAEADPATRATRDFMREYGGERVRGINDVTREALVKTLTEGMRADEGYDLLARRVRKLFRDISTGRALSIAITEVNRAITAGSLEGMRQAGVLMKTWATVRDARVRDAHIDMEGQTVPMNEPFTAPNGEQADGPGLFPSASLSVNCRCYVIAAEQAPAAAAATATPLAALARGQLDEAVRRRAVHERRYLAGVRQALRAQALAVLEELRG